MTRFIAPFLIVLAASPLAAEQDGPSLMEQGAKLFFQGLMEEMEPALQELEGMASEMEPFLKEFSAEMGPAFRDLLAQVEDWSMYHPPEMLANGDIILRRRVNKAPEKAPEPGDKGDKPADEAIEEGEQIDL